MGWIIITKIYKSEAKLPPALLIFMLSAYHMPCHIPATLRIQALLLCDYTHNQHAAV